MNVRIIVTGDDAGKKTIIEITDGKVMGISDGLSSDEPNEPPKLRSMESMKLGPEDYIKEFYGSADDKLPTSIKLNEDDPNFEADREALRELKKLGVYDYNGGKHTWFLKRR